MRLLTLVIVFLFGYAHADNNAYGSPISVCLNENTIPFINTTTPAGSIVDNAYNKCEEVVDAWGKERASLPKEMVIKQNNELRDFYIRMIEIRRKKQILKG